MKLGVVVTFIVTCAGMQIDVPLPHGHDLVGMRESLRNMVGANIDNATKDILANLVANITREVEEDVQREHDDAETLCENKRQAVEDCNTVRNDAAAGIALIENATYASRVAHEGCRAEEHQCACDKEGNITDLKHHVSNMYNNMCTRSHTQSCEADDGQYATHLPGYNASCETSAIHQFMECESNFHAQYYSDYIAKNAACKAKTGEWKAKASECDGYQTQFEADFCELRNDATIMCETYRSCRQRTESAYNSTVNTNEQLETNLKTQWKALKKLECYAEMIKEDITDFSHCDGDADVSHLDISCSPYPAPLDCNLDDVIHGPCQDSWINEYYTSRFGALDKITLRTCTPCAGWDGDAN